MEVKALCLSAQRRAEIGDVLLGITGANGGDWAETVAVVEIRAELPGGRGGSDVLDAVLRRDGESPQRVVIKIGPLADVAAEWFAYRKYLAGRQSALLTPLEAVSGEAMVPGETGDGRLGAVVYQHVAEYAANSSGEVRTLEQVIADAVDGALPLTHAVDTVRTLMSRLGDRLWQAKRAPGETLLGLNSDLGPDVHVEVDRPLSDRVLTFQLPTPAQRQKMVRSTGTVLAPASLPEGSPWPGPLPRLQPGEMIELRNVTPTALRDGRLIGRAGDLTVTISVADGAEPGFHLGAFAGRTGLTVAARVVSTRGRDIWSKVREVTGDAQLAGGVLTVHGAKSTDPFPALPGVLGDFVSGRLTSLTHGDLNPRNVLLVDGQVYLIDFARAGLRPPLYDAAWLEVCLVREVIAARIDGVQLLRLQRVLALAGRAAGHIRGEPEWLAGDTVIGRATAILWQIRAGARACHERHHGPAPWWREYESQLLIAALRTLKFPIGDQRGKRLESSVTVASVAAESLSRRPYRHWARDELLTAAKSVVPALSPGSTGGLEVVAAFVEALDRHGPPGEEFEEILDAWRDAYVGAHYGKSAGRLLGSLSRDHDLYISLKAYIRLKGERVSRGILNPFEDPFQPYSDEGFRLPSSPPNPFDYRSLPYGSSDFPPGNPSEGEADVPGLVRPRPAWAFTGEVADPDAVDLIVGEWVVVVLGDAGSGKSTVARELQYQLARAVMDADPETAASTEERRTDLGERRAMPPLLPVTVRAPVLQRTLSDSDQEDPDVGRAESLERILRDNLDEPISRDMLRVGAVHLTVDAFNEVDPTLRGQIADWVKWLRVHYPRVPVVVCHRRNGFNPSELPFPVVILQSVSVEQARDYIRTALRLRPVKDHETHAARLIDLLLDRPANPTIRDFARIPLYLWMITNQYVQEGALPTNVGELFATFSRSHLISWDVARAVGRDSTGFSYPHRVRVLETLARRLVEAGNVTDMAEQSAVSLLRQAGFDQPAERLADLVEADMLDRDGAQVRFHHQSFQEYFAAQVLYREMEDLAVLEERILRFRWREPLQMMLSFAGGDPAIAEALIDLALRADPRFAASLLRWAENPPPVAAQHFLTQQRRTLTDPRAGVFEWERAATALVEFGTEPAWQLLVTVCTDGSADVAARCAGLKALQSMRTTTRFENLQEILTHELTMVVERLLEPEVPIELRTVAAKVAGEAGLAALVAQLTMLIDPAGDWPVSSAAWVSLQQLKQRPNSLLAERYVSMCEARLLACDDELWSATDQASTALLNEERRELLGVLAEAGRIEPVLAHRFGYELADDHFRNYHLDVSLYPGIAGGPLGRILSGEHSEEELLGFFSGDDDQLALAAAHMLVTAGSDADLMAMIECVGPASPPSRLLAVAHAATYLREGEPLPALLSLLDRLAGLPLSRALAEARVALFECMPDEMDVLRRRLRFMESIHEAEETYFWPYNDLWYNVKVPDEAEISQLLLSDDEGLRLAVYLIGSSQWVTYGSDISRAFLSEEARGHLTAYSVRYLRALPPDKVDRFTIRVLVTCGNEGLTVVIPELIRIASHPPVLIHMEPSGNGLYGNEMRARGAILLALLGRMGFEAHELQQEDLADQAHAFLDSLGRQTAHPTLERGRLIGLAYLGDWISILTSLWPGDRRMHKAARNAVELWRSGPHAPTGDTDLDRVGEWIADRLDSQGTVLAADVRSTLNEIKDWIEGKIGRSLVARYGAT
ncbi:phosphotransferase [Actinoplanes missouriensis]|uniref:phosphotransferase n=1 Tax=Actinoplanes missouriensis TaxID=1866 RepID=UPI0033E251C5